MRKRQKKDNPCLIYKPRKTSKHIIKWTNGRNYTGFNIGKREPTIVEVIGNIYQNKELLK